jgi:hypothetical protein
MSESIRILYYVLWIANPVLEIGIASLMLSRGLHRKFKFFFGYLLNQIISFAIVFTAYRHSYASAFYFYWACNAIGVAFGFGVIHEVFVDVFRSFHTLRDLGTVLFKWAGLVMLLVAGVVSVSTNSTDTAPWMQAIITAQRSVRFVQVGMVLLLLVFSQYLGLSRRQHSFGIALGFGSFAVIELALISSLVGNHVGNPWMSMVNMAAYNASLIVWLGYVAVKSPARDVSASLFQSQRWEQSLSDIHHPLPPDSLIPMFEGMVDRALSRTQPEVPVVADAGSNSNAMGAAAAGGGGNLRLASVRATSKT